MSIMLVDFSYHLQIHDWGLIYFHLKEENAWDIIFEVTNFRLFLSARTSILREKSLAIYFEDSQFIRIKTFNFIVSKIYVDKRSRVR